MTSETILVEVTDRVATVTMSRPEVRNALDQETIRTLRARLTALDADDGVDAMILTGADPAFCAGLDLGYLASRVDRERAAGLREIEAHPVPPHTTPLVGAVNGAAVTGGLEVALGCDFLVASERARFADTHARVGIVPGWRLSVELPEAIGYRRAKEMSTTGNFIDASTALAWGLVNHVVPHEELLAFARQLAADIASNDRDAAQSLVGIYNEQRDVVDGRRVEIERAHWESWGADGTRGGPDVAGRRAAVIARGREQSR
ncbi:MAG TPA: enoyl-CoA hydratase [Acidimicrobiia bacterium]|jgi:enoyl-CoA hydratase